MTVELEANRVIQNKYLWITMTFTPNIVQSIFVLKFYTIIDRHFIQYFFFGIASQLGQSLFPSYYMSILTAINCHAFNVYYTLTRSLSPLEVPHQRNMQR